LEHADVVAAPPGAEEDAERGGRLALAITGVDDDERLLRQPASARICVVLAFVAAHRAAPVIASARLITAAEMSGTTIGRPVSGWAMTRTRVPYTCSIAPALSTSAG